MGRVRKKNVTRPLPTEFLLSNTFLQINSTPSTYFFQYRQELILQQLIFWLFRKTGVYFFLSQFKQRDYLFLLQFFVYKTYLNRRLKKRTQRWKRRPLLSWTKKTGLPLFFGGALMFYFIKICSRVRRQSYKKREKNQNVCFKKIWYKRKIGGALKARNKVRPVSFISAFIYKRLAHRHKLIVRQNRELFIEWKELVKKKNLKPVKPQRLLGSYRFFFVYFLYFWFNYMPVLLFKPFLKVMYLQRSFKSELKKITRRYFILFRYKWSFDFIFLLNSAMTLYNFNLFTPFFLMHILFTRHRIMRYIFNFTEILDRLFWLKRNLLGMRLLVIGPFKSKTRSIFSFQKGVLDYNFYSSRLLYETLICPTSYGVSSIKFWLYYKVPIDKI